MKKHGDIHDLHIPGVKWVEAYAAAFRIKHRISQKMIQINSHSGQHNHPCFFPLAWKKEISKNTGHSEMQEIMDKVAHLVCNLGNLDEFGLYFWEKLAVEQRGDIK